MTAATSSGSATTTAGKAPVPGKGLKAKAKANPQLVVGAGAVAVVILLALVSKNKAATDPATTGLANSTTTGRQTPAYDSTANDVYNSLSGQMQGLQDQITGLGSTASDPLPAPSGDPAPVPVPVLAPVENPVTAPAYNVTYQGSDGVINHVAAALQNAPYANGQLLYTDSTKPWLGTIQTVDSAANRAWMSAPGSTATIVGGY